MMKLLSHANRVSCTLGLFVAWVATFALAGPAAAEALRVLPPKTLPADHRLDDLVTLNSYFPMGVCKSPEAWQARRERLHRQLLMATGLWPMPTKTPAHAVVHGRIDRGDYTVQKVFFESFPGHFVTGNLYRPKRDGVAGRPGPGVLCPHGHWPNGRFYDAGEKKGKAEIAAGAEKFDPSGRYPLQARCVKLARMGCTVFHYDMIGYADSVQLAHRPGLRDRMNTPENWGYFSPQAELRLQNMMGLQTYNSVRAFDWLASLPEVDPNRIAVTGASGGGTQTFVLCAADRRPAVAFPAVMVSTAMQGGCTCENACYLRVESGNIELAALISPRPLAMSAANDWTQEILTKGLPELKAHYAMLGIGDLVTAQHFDFPHNYNYVSRSMMYGWLDKHLNLGQEKPIVEEDFEPVAVDDLSVWDASHPKPEGGDDYERSLLRWITTDSEKQMAALVPTDADSLARFRHVVGGAVDVMIGRPLGGAAVEAHIKHRGELAGFLAFRLLARCQPVVRGTKLTEEVPVIVLRPKENWNGKAVIWVDALGKRALFTADGGIQPQIGRLLGAGFEVVGVDLFGQGEFTAHGDPLRKARLAKSGRGDWAAYAGYTFGYNHSIFSKRVHDLLSVISLLRQAGPLHAESVDLVGLSGSGMVNRVGAGHWVAAARAQAGSAVARAVIDTSSFRFANVSAFDHPDFLPGGAKYFDLPGMLALSAPERLWLAGEGPEAPPVVAAAYRAAGRSDHLTVCGRATGQEAAAVDWLLR